MRYYLEKNNVGCYVICDNQSILKVLSGQHYGYCKQYMAQRIVDDLNSGKETPDSMRALWGARC